jgi:hypothetical protein
MANSSKRCIKKVNFEFATLSIQSLINNYAIKNFFSFISNLNSTLHKINTNILLGNCGSYSLKFIAISINLTHFNPSGIHFHNQHQAVAVRAHRPVEKISVPKSVGPFKSWQIYVHFCLSS